MGGIFHFQNQNHPSPSSPSPSSPIPLFPFLFLGGGKGRGGEPLHRPPEGGGTKSPPFSLRILQKLFTPAHLKTFSFFLSKYSNLQNLCNLPTLEERRQSTAQNYKKNLWCPLNKKTKFIVAYFNEI